MPTPTPPITPLNKQIVRIDFTGGLEQKDDVRLVVPGKLTTLNNGTFSSQGSLSRRAGWTKINSALSAVNDLSLFNGTLLAQVGEEVYSLASGSSTFYQRQPSTNVTLEKDQIRRSSGFQDMFDAATNGTLTCYAWRELDAAGNIYGVALQVRDEATDSVVLDDFLARSSTAAWCPRVVALSTGFLIFYNDRGTNVLYGRAILFATPTTVSAETTLASDFSTTLTPGVFDACVFGSNALVAYPSTNATASVRVLAVTISAGAPSIAVAASTAITQANVPHAKIGALACAAFSGTRAGVYVLTDNTAASPGLWGVVISSALAITAAEARLDASAYTSNTLGTIGACVSGSTMYVFTDNVGAIGSAASVSNIRLTQTDTSNAVLSSAVYQPTQIQPNGPNGPFIAGKPFVVSGGPAPYLPVAYRPSSPLVGTVGVLQSGWFLLEDHATNTCPTTHVVAKALYMTLGSPATVAAACSPPSVHVLSTGEVGVPVPELGLISFDTGGNVTRSGMSRLRLTFNSSSPISNVQLGGNTFGAGASLMAFDGVGYVEAGFYLFPERVTVANGGAGALPAGAYQYTAVYEWVDRNGQRHQSAPAVPYSYTAPGGQKAAITIPTLFLTDKPLDLLSSSTVNIVVFRTKKDGTTFYRVNAINSPLYNTTLTATVVLADETSDATLETGELLYTTGDVLENISPFPCSFVFTHQNRVFANNSEDPYGFQYSQPAVPNFGLQWNDVLIGRVDGGRGKLTGGASLDNKVIFFTERGIFVMVGTGPATTGAFNNYSQPERLPSDVGCTEPLSILEMPEGIIFKSTKGFYLLDRGLNVRYIGSAVSDYDSITCTSAVLLADEQEARFGLLNNVVLAYSYRTGQWSTYSNMETVDAIWWPTLGEYVFATAGGVIAATDSPTRGTDNSSVIATIPLSFTTAWIHLQQALHGFQRVWRLIMSGAWEGPSSLEVYAAWDDDPGTELLIASVSDTTTLRDSSLGGWELRVHMPRQKCRSVRFRVTDTPQLGSGLGGLSFSSMSLEVGLKRGMNKLPSGKSR